jgi:hypothetical protein
MTDFTTEDSRSWSMREEAHYNGGKEFFAYLHRCIQQPRLSRYDRYERSDRSVKSTWRVDGIDQTDFDTAVSALNIAPTFSKAECELLATISDDPADRRKEMIAAYEPWNGLKEKGAIEWQSGRVHRTELGRAAVSTSPALLDQDGHGKGAV